MALRGREQCTWVAVAKIGWVRSVAPTQLAPPKMSLWRVPFADEDKIAGFMTAQSVRSGDPE